MIVLLFVRSGALWAQRFNRATETADGSPVEIASAIQLPGFFGSPTLFGLAYWSAGISAQPDGILRPRVAQPSRRRARNRWIER